MAANPLTFASRVSPLKNSRLLGLGCGLFAAVGYTASNICLRAVSHCDPVWVSAVKAFPTVVLVGPWLAYLYGRGHRIFPPARVLAALAGAALLAHVGGNVLFQWSLGVIGIALAVPMTLGMMILGGAVLGRILLREGVTSHALAANAILLTAIVVLSLGAGQSDVGEGVVGEGDAVSRVVSGDAGAASAYLGVLAACFCGLAFATLGVVIRYSVSGQTRISTTMVSISLVGLAALGGLTQARIGVTGMLATPLPDFAMMTLAGAFNAVAFLALTKALQVASVVFVNALNASQTAMALAAGVLLFDEPLTATLAAGVSLTVLGLLLLGRSGKKTARLEAERSPASTEFERTSLNEPPAENAA